MVDRRSIYAVCAKNGVTPKVISRISNGKANDVYVINKEYVLRFPKKGVTTDYVQEAKVAALLSPIVTVPKTVAVGKAGGVPYILQTYVPGTLWLETSHLERTLSLYRDAGLLLRQIHALKVQNAGLPAPRIWSREFQTLWSKERVSLPRQLRDLVPSVVSVNDSSRAVLHLYDYNEGNILLAGKKIAGIIDFADATVTPKLFSLVILFERWFEYNLASPICDAFLQGYGQIRSIPRQLEKQYRIYFAMWAYNHFPDKKKYSKRLISLISSPTLKRVPAEEVMVDLIIGQAGLSGEHDALRKKILAMPKAEQMRLAKQEDFPDTWKELFEDGKTEWYEADLPPSTDFVNKIFDSGKGFMTHIGLKHSELVSQYRDKSMDSQFRARIDAIRHNLSERPRIIVLTRDFKEYSIFDGARRAVAFTLEKKNLPVYIGKRESFKALPHLR